ncbi:hypothetical protein LCGC14_1551470, partial [marine sediment metagenome]
AHLVGKGAYRYSWDLRAHLMITGDGSTGKSYVFDTVAQMSAPGTVQAITHETMQARQTDTDNSDCTMVFHEMPGRMLGVDQYGNQTSADSFLKDRLTRSMSVTSYIAIDKDSGERATKTSVARCMNATMGASNEKAPPGDSALMQRYLRWRMTRQSRPGMTAHEQMFMPEWATDPELRPHVVHGAQLHDTFLFFVEKAIHAGVLPDVNVDVARHVAQRVFAEMEKDAVPAPRPRLINVYLSLCRTATLWYAIHMELFSEMGAHHRVDARTGQSREFSPRMLIDVAKWFVCTRECAVHVLTLLEPVIMPGLREEIARAIGFAMVHGRSAAGGPPAGGDPAPAGAGAAAAGDGGDHRHAEFHPVLPSVGGAGTDFRRRRGPGGSDIVDYDYISLQGATVRAIAALIAGKIGNRPSATDVLSTLYEMQQEVIMVQPRHVAGTADAPRVEVNAAVPSRLIACAILEDCDHGRGKSVSIAIDMVNRTYGGTMRRCIVRALQNSKQRACRLITGMPYVRRDRATDLEGRVHEEVFYQVADVIELRRTDELHIVPNPFAFTCAEVSALYGHTRGGAAAASGQRRHTEPARVGPERQRGVLQDQDADAAGEADERLLRAPVDRRQLRALPVQRPAHPTRADAEGARYGGGRRDRRRAAADGRLTARKRPKQCTGNTSTHINPHRPSHGTSAQRALRADDSGAARAHHQMSAGNDGVLWFCVHADDALVAGFAVLGAARVGLRSLRLLRGLRTLRLLRGLRTLRRHTHTTCAVAVDADQRQLRAVHARCVVRR